MLIMYLSPKYLGLTLVYHLFLSLQANHLHALFSRNSIIYHSIRKPSGLLLFDLRAFQNLLSGCKFNRCVTFRLSNYSIHQMCVHCYCIIHHRWRRHQCVSAPKQPTDAPTAPPMPHATILSSWLDLDLCLVLGCGGLRSGSVEGPWTICTDETNHRRLLGLCIVG